MVQQLNPWPGGQSNAVQVIYVMGSYPEEDCRTSQCSVKQASLEAEADPPERDVPVLLSL